ncbi:cell wall-binding repeat-containing protein [Serinicoccus kebangsaanensis]|uniref:cell wall-binding repeat-containing protein n=1 Tax=Serinicoccus kebangsaanensis TaxID=2602069 RepID=UPI00178C4CC4|nr:cell wall-binding repeat-containing protein [Serinicoccus kebangsaanensis]
MRRPSIVGLTLALVVSLTTSLSSAASPSAPDADPVDPAPDSGRPYSQQAEAVTPPESPDELGETTVVTTDDVLPAPVPGAEVYPLPADGTYDITGGGFGHRIGMSQWGAHGAGLQGLSHEEIVDFYYPGTRLETWAATDIAVGITIDNDGVTRVAHRSGMRVGAAPGGTTWALPGGRSQWRVRATGSSATSCVLEGYNGSSWTSWWPSGMSRRCPVTFSSPSEGTVDLYLPNGSLRIYRGALTATHHGGAALATVNHLPEQHYLRSVVAAEMGPSFHPQALRAQSVAARTYARRSASTDYYDICDTTYCQAYRGRGERRGDGSISTYEFTANNEAVNATAGEVLTFAFPNGRRLATTMYSASTGGQTIAAGNGHDYLTAQPDPYDATPANPRHRWNASLPGSSLEQRYGIHEVARVQVLTRDGVGSWGGRILTARVEGFTSSGNYTYAHATGNGLMLARYWPTWSDGLSTDYFTFNNPGPTPTGPVRVSGENRYGTAAAVADHWSPGVSVTYIVSGQDYPDALAASARAGVYDAPLLLTKKGSIPPETAQALTRLRPARLVVIGGTEAVSNTVLRRLEPYARTGRVERVSGTNRYGTAAALAGYYPAGVDRVMLASGETFPDALAGAAVANGQEAPLLLTRPGELPQSTRDALTRLRPRQIVILGGDAAITETVRRQARQYASEGTVRWSGSDRYGTAARIAETFPRGTDPAFVALGADFPDALVAAALAGREGTPLVLTPKDWIASGTDRALTHLRPESMYVLGGDGVVTNPNVTRLGRYLR